LENEEKKYDDDDDDDDVLENVENVEIKLQVCVKHEKIIRQQQLKKKKNLLESEEILHQRCVLVNVEIYDLHHHHLHHHLHHFLESIQN
jgi:hypothetical protein